VSLTVIVAGIVIGWVLVLWGDRVNDRREARQRLERFRARYNATRYTMSDPRKPTQPSHR
jgi:hypothetical protein